MPEKFGGQKEFDPKREQDAVNKLKKWEHGDDPLLNDQSGEPWWKTFQQRGVEKHQSGKSKKPSSAK